MNNWKQAAVLFFLLGGISLFAYSKDKLEATEAESTETVEIAGTEDKGIDKAERLPYESKQAANILTDIKECGKEYYIAALETLAGDSTMTDAMLYQLQKPKTYILLFPDTYSFPDK